MNVSTKRRPERKPAAAPGADRGSILLPSLLAAGDGSRETRNFSVTSVDKGVSRARPDTIAVEEPLEIRLLFHKNGELVDQSISITMRTPGNDLELALGFLFTESIIDSYDQIESAAPATARPECNVVRIQLKPHTSFDPKLLQRNFYTTSSCGVCAKSSLEALRVSGVSRIESNSFRVSADVVRSLPGKLRRAQSVFSSTGGLHAAGLFGPRGKLFLVREDVGRHNALDKLVGEQLSAGQAPVTAKILLVSGRTSFEIVQKTLRLGAPILAAVSAPSSLAIQLAEEFGLTLLGFLRGSRFNIYSGAERIRL